MPSIPYGPKRPATFHRRRNRRNSHGAAKSTPPTTLMTASGCDGLGLASGESDGPARVHQDTQSMEPATRAIGFALGIPTLN